jgi:hypothetical protein
MQRAQLLRQLVLDSQYVIDEQRVATAILARAAARRLVATATFRNDGRRWADVRSFRPSRRARSFRPWTLRASTRMRRAAGLAGRV